MSVDEVSVSQDWLVCELLECMVEDVDHSLDAITWSIDELLWALEASANATLALEWV